MISCLTVRMRAPRSPSSPHAYRARHSSGMSAAVDCTPLDASLRTPVALRGKWRCAGCEEEHANQLGHTKAGGCLEHVEPETARARARVVRLWRCFAIIAQWRRPRARRAVRELLLIGITRDKQQSRAASVTRRCAISAGVSVPPFALMPDNVRIRIGRFCTPLFDRARLNNANNLLEIMLCKTRGDAIGVPAQDRTQPRVSAITNRSISADSESNEEYEYAERDRERLRAALKAANDVDEGADADEKNADDDDEEDAGRPRKHACRSNACF